MNEVKKDYIELQKYLGKQPSILALDPGESTGWCYLGRDNVMISDTAPKDHMKVAGLFDVFYPDIVVYESFNLYPHKAKSMIWNSFYPCEVIGVIVYKCQAQSITCVSQSPSIKAYAGPFPSKFLELKKKSNITVHSKDACQHLCYYLRQVGAIDRVFD